MSWGKYRKYKTFFISTKKEVIKIDKDGNESVVTISCKIKFIDSARLTATFLSNFVDNLTGGIHKIKCKDSDYFFKYENVKDSSIKYNCLSCSKNYSNKISEELKRETNKINLLLRKGVYLYEYIDQ